MHRFWKIKRTIDHSNKQWISPLQKIAEKFKALDLAGLEIIEAFTKAPPVPVNIFEKEEAIQRAKNSVLRRPIVITDRSARNNAIGTGIKWTESLRWFDISKIVSMPTRLNPYAAELIALDIAVSHLIASI